MQAQFHEDFRHAPAKAASVRSFGWMWSIIFAGIACYKAYLGHIPQAGFAAVAATGFLLITILKPDLLALPNRGWQQIGLLLSMVVTPIIMLLIYATAIVPTGMIRRAMGKDPLKLSFEPKLTTYWIARVPPGPAGDSMPRQF